MKIVLATGIYPPDIGGPATYVKALAEELRKRDCAVQIVTYGELGVGSRESGVEYVSKSGNMFTRWQRYAQKLKEIGHDADVIIAFSSVSSGVPLFLSNLKKPKRILRLGGDFFWERYTARGGMKGLRAWYEGKPFFRQFFFKIVQPYNHIVFSTEFQQEIYREYYPQLPAHSVIENAAPQNDILSHQPHHPFRLLFMGRFVGFKNLPALITAVQQLDNVELTLVGDGPMKEKLQKQVQAGSLDRRVHFKDSVHGEEKDFLLNDHDLLIIPSTTEISPNVALEAQSKGLPVLLTDQTGLSTALTTGMSIERLIEPSDIVAAVKKAMNEYHVGKAPHRPWSQIAEEFISLIRSL